MFSSRVGLSNIWSTWVMMSLSISIMLFCDVWTSDQKTITQLCYRPNHKSSRKINRPYCEITTKPTHFQLVWQLLWGISVPRGGYTPITNLYAALVIRHIVTTFHKIIKTLQQPFTWTCAENSGNFPENVWKLSGKFASETFHSGKFPKRVFSSILNIH